MTTLFFSLLWVLFSPSNILEESTAMHDIHMSRCDIDYREESSTLEISMRIFIDDLELDLRSTGFDSLKICTGHEKPEAESIIYDYLQTHLTLKVDGERAQLEWIGKEISEDLSAVWCYLQVSSVRPTRSIDITNDVLLSTYDDQQNIVKIVMADGERSFFIFDQKEYKGRVEVD